jgi:hypothetical protein
MSTLTIYVCVPNLCIKQVRVCKTMHVRSLNKLFPNTKKVFLFDCLFMNEEMTIGYYGIKNNDSIIALPKNTKVNPKTYQSRPCADLFDEKIQITFNSNTKSEAIRLRDLQLMKLEVKSRAFNKYVKNVREKEIFEIEPEPVYTETKYFKPETPASKPLPCFWSKTVPKSMENQPIPANPAPIVVPLEAAAKNL